MLEEKIDQKCHAPSGIHDAGTKLYKLGRKVFTVELVCLMID